MEAVTGPSTLPEEPCVTDGGTLFADAPALSIAWTDDDERPRIGEVICLPPGNPGPWRIFGRGDSRADDPHRRLQFAIHRPGGPFAAALVNPRISRVQLWLRAHGADVIELRNVGRCPLFVDGRRIEAARVGRCQLQLGRQLLLVSHTRPAWFADSALAERAPNFGRADCFGIVGESHAAWQLRREIAEVARQRGHVLLLGASGTGKELVARAIHALSENAARPLVARNAATLPEGLVSAELFGSARNFPNAGLPDRPGLVGQAHGSTLFLDEFGELPGASQAQLLRVMDDGEYQRLGEAVTRRAELRVMAATNRPESALKHDVLARFPFRIRLPDLNRQREDIALIARHVLTQLASAEPSLEARFGSTAPGGGLKVSLSFMRALVAHRYTTNVRELEYFLRQSTAKSAGGRLELPAGVGLEPLAELAPDFDGDERPAVDPGALTREQILTVLAGQGWVQQKAWRALGLSSRYALVRLMKKHRIRSSAADADEADVSNE